MAFRRSPVRSRSGPPSFAHECRRRLPAVAPKARRRAVPVTERATVGKPLFFVSIGVGVRPRRVIHQAEGRTPDLSQKPRYVFTSGFARTSAARPPAEPSPRQIAETLPRCWACSRSFYGREALPLYLAQCA